MTIWGHIRCPGDVTVLSDHTIGYTVQDKLGLGGASGVRPAVDKVVAAKMGVSYRLRDAVILP